MQLQQNHRRLTARILGSERRADEALHDDLALDLVRLPNSVVQDGTPVFHGLQRQPQASEGLHRRQLLTLPNSCF